MTTAVEALSFKPAMASDGITPLTNAVKRALSLRTIEGCLSVKDFGAVGDGITNDTAAVQACFNAACGPFSAPYSIAGGQSRSVFFPAGGYLVVPTAGPTNITGCVANSSGGCRLTLSNSGVGTNHGTTGYTTGDMVYVRNVGGSLSANGAFAVVVVDGTHLDLYANGGIASPTFSGTYTRGGTICKAAIQVKGADRIKIFGEGKGVSTLYGQTTGCSTLAFDGAYKCVFQDMNFVCGLGGIAIDLNHVSNAGPSITTQGNSFYNVEFGAGGSAWPDYCCALGFGFIMGSETAFFHCSYAIGSKTALLWANGNALSGQIFGGNFNGVQAYAQPTVTATTPTVVTRIGGHQFFPGDGIKFTTAAQQIPPGGGTLPTGLAEQVTYYVTEDAFFISNNPSFHLSSTYALAMAGTADVSCSSTGTNPFGLSLQCGPGIRISGGACPVIHGAAFQNFNGPDIEITWAGSSEAYSIAGCRTESIYFVSCPVSPPFTLTLDACGMSSGYGGPAGLAFLIKGKGNWTLNGCASAGGHAIGCDQGSLVMNACTGFPDDPFSIANTGAAPSTPVSIHVTPKKTKTITTSTYTTEYWDHAFKLLFSNASPQTITIKPSFNGGPGAGAIMEVQQIGAGKVTFTPGSGVTLNSRGNLRSLNGQWACGQLYCQAPSVWTLSGDIVA